MCNVTCGARPKGTASWRGAGVSAPMAGRFAPPGRGPFGQLLALVLVMLWVLRLDSGPSVADSAPPTNPATAPVLQPPPAPPAGSATRRVLLLFQETRLTPAI